MAVFNTRFQTSGSVTFKLRGGTASSRSTLYMMVVGLPVKGFSPVKNSYRTMPQANRSLRASTRCPKNCSGDMYEGVPSTVPAWVSSEVSVRAMPKSAILTRPSPSMIKLPGLMSRWTTPWLCECASASRISSMIRADSATVKHSLASKRSLSCLPSTNSIAMNATRWPATVLLQDSIPSVLPDAATASP